MVERRVVRLFAFSFASLLACTHGAGESRHASSESASVQSDKLKELLRRFDKRVGAIWVPMVLEAATRNDPTGSRFSSQDRRTALEFEIDRAGKIVTVAIKRSSGVEYLDRVAVEAMKRADTMDAPPEAEFPNGTQFFKQPFAFTLLPVKASTCRTIHRFRDKLTAIWQSMALEAAARNDPIGCRFMTQDRRTILEVEVDRNGKIIEVAIQQSSGVDSLDQAAAFHLESGCSGSGRSRRNVRWR
jgi:TonB family protein